MRGAAAVLLLSAAVCAAAPLLPLRDPDAQPDGLVLRDLPPGASVATVTAPDGTVRFAHEVRAGRDGGLEVRRGETWTAASGTVGTARFLLGTDGYGRDLASRLVHGGRVTLGVGLLAALLALGLGTAAGAAAALGGPAADAALMRAADVVYAIPRLFLLLLLAGLYGPSIALTVGAIAATSWMTAARIVRAELSSGRARDSAAAARAAGASPVRLAVVHLLPAAAGPVLAEGALRLAHAMLAEASLSFLGLGVPAPAASWGTLIADGRDRLLDAWWIATLPGAALAAVAAAAALLADALAARAGGYRIWNLTKTGSGSSLDDRNSSNFRSAISPSGFGK